ncbi:MAG TPA: anti-sigma factor antagonist [Actinophytocola sp.]|uniref:anti-sigma factor antagonist n=1 Tax=Actinophytocola sp. TaxID=1872138 RepID=UPI002DBB5BFB|nr:anti-sigma factor antagonist [Actinophytocola sp.]HEU5469098.1 anti-sigma factor antagonist [Actinophytocola sp.]
MHERHPEWPIHVTRRDVDDALVLRVVGKIDLFTAPQLHDAIAASLDHTSGGAIIVDLGGVTFLGSVGLAALAGAARDAAEHDRPLRIVLDGNNLVILPIELTGLDAVLELYPTVEAALNAG